MMPAGSYRRWTFRVPAEAEDLLVCALWELGTLGAESVESGGSLRIEAYFLVGPEAADPSSTDWAALGAERPEVSEVAAVDWLAEYRRRARPFDLGSGFRVDPAEVVLRPEPSGGGSEDPFRRLLRIPARTAFGTGTHASTRLAVELLEAHPPVGLAVLDLGTGSGILGMIALALGARRVVGLEIDPVAALVAGANRRANGLPVELLAGELATLATASPFELLVVNMTLGSLARCLPEMGRVLVPGVRAIISGALVSQQDALDRALAAAGFELTGPRRQEDEWIARTASFRPR
jgi:ribosomal protein L11 methyltransferase